MARTQYTVTFPAAKAGDEVIWPNTVKVYPDASTSRPLGNGYIEVAAGSFTGWSDAASVTFTRAGTSDSVTVTTGSPTGTGAAVPSAASGAAGFGWKDFVSDYGAVGDNATDNTAKLAQWITDHPNGGTLFVPAGRYVFSAAQTSGTAISTAYSGQVLLPAVDVAAARAVYTIIGPDSPALPIWGPAAGAQPTYQGGAIFRSTAVSGSFISCIPAVNFGGTARTNVHLALKNLTVRMPNNPAASALALNHANALELDHCQVDVNAADDGAITQPTTATAIGIDCPGLNNAALVHLKDSSASGYYIGAQHSEHAHLDGFNAYANLVGVQATSAGHPAMYTRLGLWDNKYQLRVTAGCVIQGTVAFESKAATGWYDTTYDIDDSNSNACGQLFWARNGVSTDALLLNGARNLVLQDLWTMATAAASSGVIARSSFGNAGSGTVAGLGVDDIAGLSYTLLGGAVATQRVNGKGKFSAGSAQLMALLNIPNAGREVSCLITLSATVDRASPGLVVRAADLNNALTVFVEKDAGGNKVTIQKIVAGAYTTVATALTGTLVNGTEYLVRARYVDGRLLIWVDDTRVLSYSLTSGECTTFNNAGYTLAGIHMYAGAGNDDLGSAFDNLSVSAA